MKNLGRTETTGMAKVYHTRTGIATEKTWSGSILEHIRLLDPKLYRYMWDSDLYMDFYEETYEETREIKSF